MTEQLRMEGVDPSTEHTTIRLPPEVLNRMREFIVVYATSVKGGWKFARTMPDIAHSYAVREKCKHVRVPGWTGTGENAFVWFAAVIRKYGYEERWKKGAKPLRYVNVDGWRYWTMGNPLPETTILNRAPITLEGKEQLRRENGWDNMRFYRCDLGHRFGVVLESVPDQSVTVEDLLCPFCSGDVDRDPADPFGKAIYRNREA